MDMYQQGRHPTFEEVYPKAEFSELIRLAITHNHRGSGSDRGQRGRPAGEPRGRGAPFRRRIRF